MKTYAVSVVLYRPLPTGQTEIKNTLAVGIEAETGEMASEIAKGPALLDHPGFYLALTPVATEIKLGALDIDQEIALGTQGKKGGRK